MKEYEITNFDFSPQLKELLKNYCELEYEENSITDNWHLWQEYLMLIRENRLNEIFENECLTNKLNDENYLSGNDRG